MSRRVAAVLLSLGLLLSAAPAASAGAPPAATSSAAPSGGDHGDCGAKVTDGTPVRRSFTTTHDRGIGLSSLLPRARTERPPLVRRAALPLSPATCTGVRPGAMVTSAVGLCTLNYLFRGADGRSYIGTAGHCALGLTPGEEVWGPGQGPEAFDAVGRRIGEFAYAVLGGVRDFALIRLDPGVTADPQVCHFGGPTGINTDRSNTPTVVQHVGQGMLLGQLTPARTGVALSMADNDQLFFSGVALFGDSGGPVNSIDGRAVGVLVTVGLHLAGVPNAGLVGVTRLAPQLAQAERALGMALQLQTAPRL